MASYTVRNVGGTCQAFKLENGTETMVCSQGEREDVGLSTYTVEKEGGVCCIFEVKKRHSGGRVTEQLVKVCSEGQTL